MDRGPPDGGARFVISREGVRAARPYQMERRQLSDQMEA